jgi:hypothetical protein
MRVFVLRPLAFAAFSLAAGLFSGRVLAQADSSAGAVAAEPPEELTVRGRKTEGEYRLELERARNDIFRIFNEANKGNDTDIRCRDEKPTGRRIAQTVCRSSAEERAYAAAGSEFLRQLFFGSGGHITGQGSGSGAGPGSASAGGTVFNSNAGTGRAQQAGSSGEANASAQWEVEWNRLLTENRDLYTAVVKYAELDDEYARARGATVAPLPDLSRGAPVAQSPQQVCEASTLTEYQQRNNLAHVTGTVSISSCQAGTTGAFTVVARVRNDGGDVTPLEFNETWQRADAEDHHFESDYPIGDNVFLQSVRVRDLQCTCADPAQ